MSFIKCTWQVVIAKVDEIKLVQVIGQIMTTVKSVTISNVRGFIAQHKLTNLKSAPVTINTVKLKVARRSYPRDII